MPEPLIPTLALQVTYQCNIQCRHCGTECGPHERDWMTLEEMQDLILQAADCGALNVVFTGGEPTLLGDKLAEIIRFARDTAGFKSMRMVTNGMWASSYQQAHKRLREWREAGLTELNVSCGEYHQEFVPLANAVNAYRAGRDLDYVTVLLAGEFLADGKGRLTPQHFKDALGEDLLPPDVQSPFIDERHGLSPGKPMNYGRGRHLDPALLAWVTESELPTLCSEVFRSFNPHPDGQVTACCGVMVKGPCLLTIGNWRQQRLRDIAIAARQDLVLNWIRYVGLKDMKAWLCAKDPALRFPDRFITVCDLCAQVVYNPRAQEILARDGREREGDVLANLLARISVEDGPLAYGPDKVGRGDA